MILHRISAELSEFLNEFGIFIETDRESNLFLKYRLFPTDDVRERCRFDCENGRKVKDTFYDQFDHIKNEYSFSKNRFYREREWENETPEFIVQTSSNIDNRYHVYSKKEANKPEIINEGFTAYLEFEFYRFKSLAYPNVCLDQLIIPQINIPYEVVSIKERIDDINQITEHVKNIFRIAHQISLEGETLFDKNLSENLLESHENLIYPMYSKLFYALQMSEHYEAYLHFSTCDPVTIPVEIRINVVSDKQYQYQSCYNKLWLWLIQYQIHFFQTRLEHSQNKKDDVQEIRNFVEEKRKSIFEDYPIELFFDPEDELVF